MGNSGFQGFGKGALTYFKDIAAHNNKEWFDDNRQRYLDEVIAPAQAFVLEMGARLKKIAPGIGFSTDYNGKGSIKKIQTDRRFNPERTPYKTWVEILFWEGPCEVKKENSGFYFRLAPDSLILAGGMKYFNKPVLKVYRETLADLKLGAAIAKAAAAVEKAGYQIEGSHFARPPAGTTAEHPHAALLLHDGLYCYEETKPPRELSSAGFADYCFERWKKMAPLHKALVDMLNANKERL
jgi:uncharacterized protein (TIGR02453 family)